MFELLVARSQAVVAAAELYVPLPEHAFARAAVGRLTSLAKRAPTFSCGFTYVSGPEGSGKSLLTRQVAREAIRHRPKLRYVIATAEELGERLVAAHQQQSLADSLEEFGTFDLFICEDLHGLEGKLDQQELLLGMIESSASETTRVLITSRKLPGELREFSQRWISRCHGGLCASLPWPGPEGRRELIARLAHAKQLPLSEPSAVTIEWLAERWTFSPRDITRSIETLANDCQTRQTVIDIPYLERWLSKATRTVSLTLDAIATEVAHEFGIEANELRSRSRHQGLIVPRQCAMFLAKELTGRPLESIGLYFGERTHTTVSHSLSRLKELLPHAPTLRQQVQKLRKRLAELRREDCA